MGTDGTDPMLSRCQRCRRPLQERQISTMAASQRDRICPTCQAEAPLSPDAVKDETRTRLQYAGAKEIVRKESE